MGSEKGKPTSMRFAPLAATAGSSSRVKARSGSPAVTNGMNAVRPAARSELNSVSIGFMASQILDAQHAGHHEQRSEGAAGGDRLLLQSQQGEVVEQE